MAFYIDKGGGILTSQKYRRITILFVVILFSLSVSSAYGASMFTDMVETHWAYEYVEKLVDIGLMDGYEDATFRPNQIVNTADALVYITRLYNFTEEEIEKKRNEYAHVLNRFDLSEERENAIAIALSEDLITEAYVNNNLFSKGELREATKAEISKYFAIALGMEEREESVYALLYNDTDLIPERTRPYIKFLIDKGILDAKGDETGNFNPNQPVTRAVLAKMLYLSYTQLHENSITPPKANEKEPERVNAGEIIDDKKGLTGIITGKIDKFLIIDHGHRVDSYQLAKDAKIIIGGNERSIYDIEEGMTVRVTVDEGNIIKSLTVDKDLDIFTGTISKINFGSFTSSIFVTSAEGVTKAFNILDNTHIRLNGRTAYLFSIKEGDWVKVEVFDNIALTVIGESRDGKVEGIIKDINLDENIISVEREDGSVHEYLAGKGLIINRNFNGVSLEDLRRGDRVVLSIANEELESIEAESVPGTDEGYIKEVFISRTPKLTILNHKEEIKDYHVSSKVLIKKDGEIRTIYDLRLEDYVKLNLESDEIMVIEVENKK